jgi:hypothetical protein
VDKLFHTAFYWLPLPELNLLQVTNYQGSLAKAALFSGKRKKQCNRII